MVISLILNKKTCLMSKTNTILFRKRWAPLSYNLKKVLMVSVMFDLKQPLSLEPCTIYILRCFLQQHRNSPFCEPIQRGKGWLCRPQRFPLRGAVGTTEGGTSQRVSFGSLSPSVKMSIRVLNKNENKPFL